jgi:hypothetical protein
MLTAIQRGAAAIGLATALLCPIAKASTAVYTFGGLLSGDIKECLSRAKTAATKTGFTDSQQVTLDVNQKGGDFHASQPGSPLSMTMRCDPSLGVYSIGVSGIDGKATFENLRAIVRSLLTN